MNFQEHQFDPSIRRPVEKSRGEPVVDTSLEWRLRQRIIPQVLGVLFSDQPAEKIALLED